MNQNNFVIYMRTHMCVTTRMSCTYLHAHLRLHACTCTHTYLRPHAHLHSAHPHTHVRIRCTSLHACTLHVPARLYMHGNAFALFPPHTRTPVHAHTYPHARTRPYTHLRPPACACTHPYMRTPACMPTYIHTCPVYPDSPMQSDTWILLTQFKAF